MKCHHNRIFTTQKEYGIVSYLHVGDGADCTVLNSYGISTERALAIVNLNPQDNATAVAIFVASRIARLQIYKKMSEIRDENELLTVLQRVVEVIVGSARAHFLMQEFVTIFQVPGRANLHVIGFGTQHAFTQELVTERVRLPMMKLRSSTDIDELDVAIRVHQSATKK